MVQKPPQGKVLHGMKYFYEIPAKSQIAGLLLNFARSVDRWEIYYAFEAVAVPPEMLAQDPVMSRLLKDYTLQAGVLRMPANTCYRWHIDASRKVSVNMLLEDDGGSRCVFTESISKESFPITELKYQPDTYYVFNTQKPHMVTNFTTPRYLFSVEFMEKDRPMVFDQLQSNLQNIWN